MGILSRAQATAAIREGRVRVNGTIVRDPRRPVVPERARIELDGTPQARRPWRTILFHKPRGVVTTTRDPEGRRTVYDVIGEDATGLMPVGRLDWATSGLLILTNDTQLAKRITDPVNSVSRVYVVSVRGKVTPEDARAMRQGILDSGEWLHAESVAIRKTSARESHLTVELREGKNREVRRLCDAVGHEVTRLKRVRIGGLEIRDLEPGHWRDLTREEIERALG